MNLFEFKEGDIIRDKYSDNHYEVIEPDKSGMSKIRKLSDGGVEYWNAYNNNRFYKMKGQLSLFTN